MGRKGGASKSKAKADAAKANGKNGGRPRKNKPQSRVREIYKDDDGWWANLAIGWTVDGCSGVRADTKRELMERIKDAVQAPER